MMLLLVLLLVVGGSLGSCPFSCDCSADYLHVQCINASLQIVPLTLHPEIRSLVLNFNPISEVGPASFQFHPELRTVDLKHSALRSLQDKTFEAQRRLVNLDLSHNQVEVIKQLTFFGLQNLQTLDLSFNKLTSIEGQVFKDLPSLTHLRLASNRIKEVADTGLSGLGALRSLSLADNRLTSVPEGAWDPSTNLRELILAGNRINQLNLRYLTTLETLDISDNAEINVTGLAPLPAALRSLDISGLRLPSVPTQLLSSAPGLLALHLNGNNFTTIPNNALRGLKRLRTLEIMGNQRLKTIDEKAFVEPANLISLNISGNRGLTSLPPNSLLYLRRLEVLNLTNNGFTSLSLRLGDSVSDIFFSGNPWLCNCNLQDLQTLALQRNLSVSCSAPEDLSGRDILELDLSSCLSSQSMVGTSDPWGRDTLTIVILSVVLATAMCVAGFMVYHFRGRLQDVLKSLRGRKPEGGKEPQYSPEYQRSFIQHDEYFISLARQNEQPRHIPVTEL